MQTVYHGTVASCRGRIEAEGLVPSEGAGPFVTDDAERAAAYAVRAVCLDLVEAGRADRPDLAPAALLVALLVGPDGIELDPGSKSGSDYVLAGDPVRTAFHEFDPRPHLPDEAVIHEFANLMRTARTLTRRRMGLEAARG